MLTISCSGHGWRRFRRLVGRNGSQKNPHRIEEIECRAVGHYADVFKIWKTPEKEGG